eukprot:scaffold765_cov151-Chaetoceros_neogracile.AAC.2
MNVHLSFHGINCLSVDDKVLYSVAVSMGTEWWHAWPFPFHLQSYGMSASTTTPGRSNGLINVLLLLLWFFKATKRIQFLTFGQRTGIDKQLRKLQIQIVLKHFVQILNILTLCHQADAIHNSRAVTSITITITRNHTLVRGHPSLS